MTPALVQPDRGQAARTIHVIDADGYDAFIARQPAPVRDALAAQGLKPNGYAHAILPGDDWSVVTVVASADRLSSWCLARLAETLPEGTYRLADGQSPGAAMFGWAAGQYRFDRYRDAADVRESRILLAPDAARIGPVLAEVAAGNWVRDLVNTPASDLGPAAMEEAALTLAPKATVSVTRGDALAAGFPLIHAVGAAAERSRAPRLIEIAWGEASHPRITIVGKGISFDTGGLDIKTGGSMRLMKKDMGGAAHALALARLVIDAGLPVRLHVLIPVAENSIAGAAMRPGDVFRARNGVSVEIGNTDAEGRLILADALVRAGEEAPELIIDFATLTGAARVALGPDLPALFANDDALADALLAGGRGSDDPVWRLPLHDGYRDMLKGDVAELTNAPDGGLAGAVTAALFLERFVPAGTPWAHLDTFAWRPAAKPGRPKGGAALGLRAAWSMLRTRYGG